MITRLITIPKFAEATGLPYRLCLQLVGQHYIPSVSVGHRRRIDMRWVDQWLADGGYRPNLQDSLRNRVYDENASELADTPDFQSGSRSVAKRHANQR
jgi:hypothetical protein